MGEATAKLFGKVESDAAISACGRYRWTLTRSWDVAAPWLGFIMLNPSTADAKADDPTIRKCMGFAKQWNFGGIAIRNLFNWRATDPNALLTVPNPICNPGDESTANEIIVSLWPVCPKVVCAWGAIDRRLQWRADAVVKLLHIAGIKTHALGLTDGGFPRHPLYLPYATELIEWGGSQ